MSIAPSISQDRSAGVPRRADQASRLRSLVEAALGRSRTAGGAAPAPPLDGPGPGPVHAAPVIAVASGKGGVGKSNVAVNLSIALSRRGVRVTLLDADMGVANADVLCGLNPRVRIDQAMERGGLLDEIAVEAPGGFRLVPGAVGLARLADLTGAQQQWLIDRLVDLEVGSGAIVIDTPAGVGTVVMAMTGCADLTLVVATPEPTSIADAYALLKCLAAEHAGRALTPRLGLVVNQAASVGEVRDVHARLDAVTHRFLRWRVPLAGWIPTDPALPACVRARRPLLLAQPRAKASKALERLADQVRVSLRLGQHESLSIAERLTVFSRLRRTLWRRKAPTVAGEGARAAPAP